MKIIKSIFQTIINILLLILIFYTGALLYVQLNLKWFNRQQLRFQQETTTVTKIKAPSSFKQENKPITSAGFTDLTTKIATSDQANIISILHAPNLTLPLFQQVNTKTLSLGGGLMTSYTPGYGYSVFAGHNYGDQQTMFSPLTANIKEFETVDQGIYHEWQVIDTRTIDSKAINVLATDYPTANWSVDYQTADNKHATIKALNQNPYHFDGTLMLLNKTLKPAETMTVSLRNNPYQTYRRETLNVAHAEITNIAKHRLTTDITIKNNTKQPQKLTTLNQSSLSAYMSLLTCTNDHIKTHRHFITAQLITAKPFVSLPLAKQKQFESQTIKKDMLKTPSYQKSEHTKNSYQTHYTTHQKIQYWTFIIFGKSADFLNKL